MILSSRHPPTRYNTIYAIFPSYTHPPRFPLPTRKSSESKITATSAVRSSIFKLRWHVDTWRSTQLWEYLHVVCCNNQQESHVIPRMDMAMATFLQQGTSSVAENSTWNLHARSNISPPGAGRSMCNEFGGCLLRLDLLAEESSYACLLSAP